MTIPFVDETFDQHLPQILVQIHGCHVYPGHRVPVPLFFARLEIFTPLVFLYSPILKSSHFNPFPPPAADPCPLIQRAI